jgi:hypothetical protein
MPTADDAHKLGRRCSMCGITWPTEFEKCYQCGGETSLSRSTDGPSITFDEARSMKNHYEFERYLEKEGRI